MEPVKNYNIQHALYAKLDKEERESLDRMIEEINCTYTIIE